VSHRILIFVDTQSPLEEFVPELQALLEVEFEQRSEERSSGLAIWYEALPQRIWLEVFEHDLESDEDMALEEYPYEIRLRGPRIYWEERERRLYEYAHFAFDKLKEQGKYRLMMTDGMREIMEMFSPVT